MSKLSINNQNVQDKYPDELEYEGYEPNRWVMLVVILFVLGLFSWAMLNIQATIQKKESENTEIKKEIGLNEKFIGE